MSKTVTILRSAIDPKQQTGLIGYVLALNVTASQNITKKIFVKQRVRTNLGTIDDVFVAVSSPEQLEDLAEDNPRDGTSYFRSDNICIIASNEAYLTKVFDTIMDDVQLLMSNSEALDILAPDGTYVVSSSGVNQIS